MSKQLIIDTSYLMYRSYFAYPNLTIDGKPVGAFYGFAKTIISLLKEYQPENLIFAQDSREKTWRHEIFGEYKAGRPPMEDNMKIQIPLILDWCKLVTNNCLIAPGYEADDIIHTVAEQFVGETTDGLFKGGDDEVYIFSSDKDLYQMLNSPKIHFIRTKNGYGLEHFGQTEFIKKHELDPKQWVDYKALVGDSSDNLKGVTGVGPKTAVKILQGSGNLFNLFQYLELDASGFRQTDFALKKDSIQDKKLLRFLDKIKEDQDHVRQTYKLAMLQDVPDLEVVEKDWNLENSVDVFEEYHFSSLVKEVETFDEKELESESLF